jgi:hypothetical protein
MKESTWFSQHTALVYHKLAVFSYYYRFLDKDEDTFLSLFIPLSPAGTIHWEMGSQKNGFLHEESKELTSLFQEIIDQANEKLKQRDKLRKLFL